MKKVFSFFTLILLFFSLSTYTISAFSPHVEPWYSIKWVFDEDALPSGVIARPFEQSPEDTELVNTSQTPLILLGRGYVKCFGEKEDKPECLIIKYKLADSKRQYYSEHEGKYYEAENMGVVFTEMSGQQFGVEIENVIEDHRPLLQKPPQDQIFTIHAIYAEEPIDITGKIVYSLNPKYDSNGVKKGEEASKRWSMSQTASLRSQKIFLIGTLLGISALIILIFILVKYKSLKKHKKR